MKEYYNWTVISTMYFGSHAASRFATCIFDYRGMAPSFSNESVTSPSVSNLTVSEKHYDLCFWIYPHLRL